MANGIWAARMALFLLATVAVMAAPREDLVTRLPGKPVVPFKQCSGYVTVDEAVVITIGNGGFLKAVSSWRKHSKLVQECKAVLEKLSATLPPAEQQEQRTESGNMKLNMFSSKSSVESTSAV